METMRTFRDWALVVRIKVRRILALRLGWKTSRISFPTPSHFCIVIQTLAVSRFSMLSTMKRYIYSLPVARKNTLQAISYWKETWHCLVSSQISSWIWIQTLGPRHRRCSDDLRRHLFFNLGSMNFALSSSHTAKSVEEPASFEMMCFT